MVEPTPAMQAMFDQADAELGQLITDLVGVYQALRARGRSTDDATSDMIALVAKDPGVLGLSRDGMSAALAYAVRRLAGE